MSDQEAVKKEEEAKKQADEDAKKVAQELSDDDLDSVAGGKNTKVKDYTTP